MIFIVLFLVLPLIEIALFVEIGGVIGVGWTLTLCVLTAIGGGLIFRAQGLYKLREVQTAMDRGRLPIEELFDGACILVAGALLMTPGFATDAIGFSLFVPQVRRFLAHQIAKRKNISVQGYGGGYGTGFEDGPESFSTRFEREFYQHPHRRDRMESIDVDVERVDDDNPETK